MSRIDVSGNAKLLVGIPGGEKIAFIHKAGPLYYFMKDYTEDENAVMEFNSRDGVFKFYGSPGGQWGLWSKIVMSDSMASRVERQIWDNYQVMEWTGDRYVEASR